MNFGKASYKIGCSATNCFEFNCFRIEKIWEAKEEEKEEKKKQSKKLKTDYEIHCRCSKEREKVPMKKDVIEN